MNLVVLEHAVDFAASPSEVYDTLTDSRRHAAFTGMKAKLSRKVGGSFSTCEGRNFGFNLALEPGARIAQAWSHLDLPEGLYTLVEFRLKKSKRGTKLRFTQIGVPERDAMWLSEGWSETYWQALALYFEATHKRGK